MFKKLELRKFSFAHEQASMKPRNIFRWWDSLDIRIEVITSGGEVLKDSLVIKKMEVVGETGMSARMVVITQRVGSAGLYLDIAQMNLEDLRDVCKTKNVALSDPNIPTFCGYIGRKPRGKRSRWLAGI